jgi:tetraacyldisaccharide 4'-kinase
MLLSVGETFYKLGLAAVGKAYEKNWLKTHDMPAKVVSVGNLTWGGTGKTPMVIQLAKGLSGKHRVAVLTRGYGGDEASLLAEKLKPVPVLVDPDRVASGQKAVKSFGADLLLLDDGYQQWRLKKDLDILMVDASAPFGNRHLIPRGTLREPVSAAARAGLIVIKDGGVTPQQLAKAEAEVRAANNKAPLFIARYKPSHLTVWPSGKEVPLSELKKRRICSLAGIARPEQFEHTLDKLGAQFGLKYREGDHHPYSAGELMRILSRAQRHGIKTVVTTAKDAVKFPSLLVETLGPQLKGMEILVLEVSLEFKPDESQLLHRIDTLLGR